MHDAEFSRTCSALLFDSPAPVRAIATHHIRRVNAYMSAFLGSDVPQTR